MKRVWESPSIETESVYETLVADCGFLPTDTFQECLIQSNTRACSRGSTPPARVNEGAPVPVRYRVGSFVFEVRGGVPASLGDTH